MLDANEPQNSTRKFRWASAARAVPAAGRLSTELEGGAGTRQGYEPVTTILACLDTDTTRGYILHRHIVQWADGLGPVGKFIDHDITFDTGSTLGVPRAPERSPNGRTPVFDLESVYGAGPVASPHLYDP